MTTQPQHTVTLFALVGGINHECKLLQQTAHTIWLFAYTALWNGESFSATEITSTKKQLTDLLMQPGSVQRNYEEIVQRILLTRAYLNRNPQKYVPLPTEWLNPQNTNGFAGTASWYQQLVLKRKALPLYKQPLHLMTQAVQELTDTPTATTFHYWRTYFAEQGNQPLLNLFLSFVANARF